MLAHGHYAIIMVYHKKRKRRAGPPDQCRPPRHVVEHEKEGYVVPPQKKWAFYTEPDRVLVRDVDVAYRRKGAGEPVVFLHGAGLTRRWLPFYEEMSSTVDLVVPEHPGFGDTVMPEWLEDFDDLALHYDDLADELGLDTFHLVGHSLGGWIAAHFAVLFGHRLRSLQLIAPGGLRGSALTDPFRQGGEEALDRTFNGRAADYPEYLEEDEPIEQLIQDYIELTTRARLAWNPRYDARLSRRLARVKVPTQVILPDEDRILDSAVVAQYADFIQGAKAVTIHGTSHPTSHVPFVQEPEGLAEIVTSFINANGAPS